MNKAIKQFSVALYGELEKYSDTISRGRCRVFYKGANRNGTFITDSFAQELLKTIPYTPIKGIYEEEDKDFSDHGEERHFGRVYGIVPENPNLRWEEHLDSSGETHTYACVDVLLFTALYDEATEIMGKAQSMELYEPSIEGEWQIREGKKLFVFTKGSFLGLQVLGDDVEPCFEGAAFFTLYETLKEWVKKLEEYNLDFSKKIKGGNSKMNKIKFKLSDSEKHDKIWDLLNPNFNEEGGWEVAYTITAIYDEYALVYSYEEDAYFRIYYFKDDKEDTVTIEKKEKCFIVDVNEEEKAALDTIQKLNGGSFAKIDEEFARIPALEEENSEFELKIKEQEETISTLKSEQDIFTSNLEEAQEKIKVLSDFKKEVELKEKKLIIEKYQEQLSEEIITNYTKKIEEYDAISLDKELAYELIKSNPTIFSKGKQPDYLPKDEPKGGIEELLSKYKK